MALAIAASVIVLAWSEAPIGSMAGSVSPGGLFGGLFGVFIGSFVWAVILRAGAEWVEHKDVKYADAYATMLLFGIASLILGVALLPTVVAWLPVDTEFDPRIAYLSTVPLAFLILAGLVSLRHQIPFRRAILVCLVMLALGVALALTVAAIAYLIRLGYRRIGVIP